MQQRLADTKQQCPARKVPSGELVLIPAGEFLNINQSLGGNFTVTWRGNMYRIDGTDAAAIGQHVDVIEFADDGSEGISEDQVWQALDTIFDPEIPISLVALGLIYKVEVDADRVNVDMTLTAPGCGMGPVLVSDVEYRLLKVPNVNSVSVELVFDPPWSRDMMTEEAQLEAGLFF